MNYSRKLDNLWRDISQNKLFKLKNLFKDLYLLYKYDLRFLKRENLKLKFDPQLLPDCASCPQNCCHGAENTVSLRLVDIARLLDAGLEDAIDMDNQSFKNDPYFQKEKKALKYLNNDNWNLFPVLKRVNNICPYRDQDNHCTIYEHRPITCRRFPYIITQNKKNIVFSKKCYSTKKEDNPPKQKELLQAALDSYNEKIKDLILIHYAQEELQKIELAQWLKI